MSGMTDEIPPAKRSKSARNLVIVLALVVVVFIGYKVVDSVEITNTSTGGSKIVNVGG